MQKGFRFDAERCTGCEACRIACAIENRLDPWIDWRQVRTFNPRRHPDLPSLHSSMACNHCIEPPCMEHCPALAYTKDPVTGALAIDAGRCIGCKYCSWACPYDAPQFNARSGLIEKCTFCSHRLAEGSEPACVALCPTGALGFGDHEPSDGAPRIPGFTQTEIGPAIRFAPLRSEVPPTMHAPAGPTDFPVETLPDTERKIGLRTEWTLLCFTLVAALLVAWVAVGAAVDAPLRPGIVLPAGLAAMALSTLHLGKKLRAWRAISNLRRSWLSREVVLFTAFLALAGATTSWDSASGPLAGAAAVAGFAALYAMDRVYAVTGTPGLATHSAQVFLTGFLFLGLWAANASIAVTVAILKIVLYVARKARFAREGRPWCPLRSLIRVLLVLPAWIAPSPAEPAVVHASILVAVAAGELIDRAEYYLELDPPTPSRQLADDMQAGLAGIDPTVTDG